jgi:glucokinase
MADNGSGKVVIALDIGGSSIKSATVSSAGCLVSQPVLTPVDSQAEAGSIIDSFAAAISQHLNNISETDLLGVAIGMPGPFDYEVGISYISGVAKYEAIYGMNIKTALQQVLGRPTLPIVFRNDAEAAIMGEALYGAGRPYRRLIGVTLGTGIGSAFVVEGRSVGSGPGVPPHGWLYQESFRDLPADDVFSTRGLTARLRELNPAYESVAAFAEAARRGDALLRQGFLQFGADLGEFLASFAQAFGAEVILVLGGIARSIDLFEPLLRQKLPVPALPGQLGPTAPLLGAAELLFEPHDNEKPDRFTKSRTN